MYGIYWIYVIKVYKNIVVLTLKVHFYCPKGVFVHYRAEATRKYQINIFILSIDH